MSVFTKKAVDLFSPVNADGSPRRVANNETQIWGTELERLLVGILNGLSGPVDLPELIYHFTVTGGTVNNIVATTNAVPPAGIAEALFTIITSQPNTGPVTINGKPLRSASGSELPGGMLRPGLYSFLDAGGSYRLLQEVSVQFTLGKTTGEANQLQVATTSYFPREDGASLLALPIIVENTGSVRVSINGEDSLPLVGIDGNDVVAGDLTPGATVLCFRSGGKLRMVNDPSSLRHVTQVHADRVAAEEAKTAAEQARDIAAGYASDAVSQGNVPIYATRQGLVDLEIPAGMSAIRVNGYSTVGDGGQALYKRVAEEPTHICKVQSDDGAWWEMVIENNLLPAVCVGFFGNPGVDRTAELQALVDGVPDFLTIVFERHSYAFKAITVTKSLVLDWNDSTLTVDPERDSTSSASPAMYFTGKIGARYDILPLTSAALGMTDRLTLSDPTDVTNFVAGDYVEITDTAFVPPWDQGLPGQIGTGFTGRKEMNKVLRVSGSLLYLEKSVEWPYNAAPKVAKITPLITPGVCNIKQINEIDPGAQYTGSTLLGPHLMCFRFCVSPLVERVVADKFQLHVCQFSVCDKPVIRFSEGKYPFRPTIGGHGYLVQFDRCNSGLSYRNQGTRLRHLTDFTQCYDCISQENVAHAPWGSQFGGHGMGAKRFKSIDDTVHMGGGEYPSGWNSGNPTFGGDMDFTIVRPRAYGRCSGLYAAKVFSFGYTTSGVTIIDAVAKVTSAPPSGTDPAAYTIGLEVVGASKVKMIGGDLDWQWTSSGHTSDGPFNIRAINGLKSSDIEIINVNVIGSRSESSAIVKASDIDGVLKIKDCTLKTATAASSAILVTGTSEELDIVENRIRNGGIRGISVANEPTRNKRIRDNVFQGVWTTELHGVAGT